MNLNSEYEGGHVLFPGTGAGVGFYEAAPVTKGRRYVLLTFLHNAAAQSRWLASTARRG
ncbi:MAG: hypothetical protein WAV18_12000 [Roseiarcus sp.]